MKLPPQAIREFQTLWREQFGVDLAEEAASTNAVQLLSMMQAICKPPAVEHPPPNNKGPPL